MTHLNHLRRITNWKSDNYYTRSEMKDIENAVHFKYVIKSKILYKKYKIVESLQKKIFKFFTIAGLEYSIN